jgi:hypothetical protein
MQTLGWLRSLGHFGRMTDAKHIPALAVKVGASAEASRRLRLVRQHSGRSTLAVSDSSPCPGILLGRLLVGWSGGNLKPAQEQTNKEMMVKEIIFTPLHSRQTFPLSAIKSKADLHCHLPVRNLVIFEVAAHLGDLKPFHVSDRFASSGDRVVNCVFYAIWRGTDQLDLFVDMVTHKGNSVSLSERCLRVLPWESSGKQPQAPRSESFRQPINGAKEVPVNAQTPATDAIS